MKTIHKLLFLSIFMLIALGTTDKLFADFYNCIGSTSGCVELTSTPLSFEVTNSNGDVCLVDVEYTIWKCTGSPDVYKVNIDNLDFVTCESYSPNPDHADIMKAAQNVILTYINSLSPLGTTKKVELNIPACYELTGSTSYIIVNNTCGNKCCKHIYTINNNSIIEPTTYSSENECDNTIGTLPPGCVQVCEETKLPLGQLDPIYQKIECGSNGTDPITTGFYTGVFTNPSCTFSTVTESWEDSNGKYHVRIKDLQTWKNSTSDIETVADFKKFIERMLIARDTILDGNYNDDNIIFEIPSCWQDFERHFLPCSDDCCTIEFEIVDDDPFEVNCLTTITPITCYAPCLEVCSEITNIEYPNYNKLIFNNENEMELNTKISIIPNPSYSRADINIVGEQNGLVLLNFMTIDGQIIATRKINKIANVCSYNIDTKTFTNGTYLISIQIDGKNLTTVKFIIQN